MLSSISSNHDAIATNKKNIIYVLYVSPVVSDTSQLTLSSQSHSFIIMQLYTGLADEEKAP